MERELLMKRFKSATLLDTYDYVQSDMQEVFIGYVDGEFVTARYSGDISVIVLSSGECLKVYTINAPKIIKMLYLYSSEDVPNRSYACAIKECPKCGSFYMVRHRVSHARQKLCWRCKPLQGG